MSQETGTPGGRECGPKKRRQCNGGDEGHGRKAPKKTANPQKGSGGGKEKGEEAMRPPPDLRRPSLIGGKPISQKNNNGKRGGKISWERLYWKRKGEERGLGRFTLSSGEKNFQGGQGAFGEVRFPLGTGLKKGGGRGKRLVNPNPPKTMEGTLKETLIFLKKRYGEEGEGKNLETKRWGNGSQEGGVLW